MIIHKLIDASFTTIYRSSSDQDPWKLGEESAYVDLPYTIRGTPCGHPGLYTRLTPEFIKFGSKVEKQIGAMDKILIREWSKLRWGVYDEVHVNRSGVSFYDHSDLKVRPVSCSMEIKGELNKPY